MKKNPIILIQLLILVCLMISISSCNMHIEKRRYRKGYYVDLVHQPVKQRANVGSEGIMIKHEPKKSEISIENKAPEKRDSIVPTLEVQKKHSEKKLHKKTQPLQPKLQKRGDHCDIITFKDGSQVEAIIEEIGATEIKYKKCNFKDGPSFRTSKANIKKIDMYNGQVYVPEDIRDIKRNGKSGNGITITVLVLGILATICVIIGGILSGGYGFVATAALAPAGILSLVGLIMGAVNLGRDTSALSWIAFVLNLLMQILAIVFTILMFL